MDDAHRKDEANGQAEGQDRADVVRGQGKDARQQRLKQALRENLRRRKAQARQRDGNDPRPSNLHEPAIAKDAGGCDE